MWSISPRSPAADGRAVNVLPTSIMRFEPAGNPMAALAASAAILLVGVSQHLVIEDCGDIICYRVPPQASVF